jgi:serine/threonine-protein kinase
VLRAKWTLDELLGLGGMAAVYAATHRNGNRVAIKILEPEAATVKDVRTRFLREGYLANQVEHVGAVSIQDDDVDEDGTPFLVMELLDGQTLDTRWQNEGKLPWQDALLVAHGMLDVLAAAQEKGIVHRDLKPGNIFIERTGSIKVLDFGIARLAQDGFQPGTTGYDTALGTPGFISPEQARGRWDEVDGKSDIFSVGATMFAILSGRHVHEAETANEQFALAMTEKAPPLAEVAPEVPPEVCEIVDRALRYDKKDRWDDAASMMSAVASVYHDLVGEVLKPAPRPKASSPRASREILLDAPTMAADTTHDRKTTTRPVSNSDTEREGQSRRVLLGGAAVLLLAAGGFAVVSASGTDRAATPAASGLSETLGESGGSATAASVAKTPDSAPSTPPQSASAPQQEPEDRPAEAPQSKAADNERPEENPAVSPRSRRDAAAGALAPSGSAAIDIFTRRK